MINWIAPLRELVGLFVEDGALALAIIAIVALAGIVAALAPSAWWLSGAILLLGPRRACPQCRYGETNLKDTIHVRFRE
jgi:hypothetical protein